MLTVQVPEHNPMERDARGIGEIILFACRKKSFRQDDKIYMIRMIICGPDENC
jgi:hypothetical protein